MKLSAVLLLLGLGACGLPGTYYGHFESDLYDAPTVHAGTVINQLNRCPGRTDLAATTIRQEGTRRKVAYAVVCD